MNTRRTYILALLMLTVACLPACDALLGVIGANTTTIELVNNATSTVAVELYVSDTQEVPEALITTLGDKIERSVSAGATSTITRSCDDLQALLIDKADLQVIGDIGPSAGTDIIRDGSDFNCGDTIRLTFTQNAPIPTELSIDVEVN